MQIQQEFMNICEKFMKKHKMSPTRFSVLATGYDRFWPRLKEGKTITFKLGDKVFQFMKDYEKDLNKKVQKQED